MRLSDFADEVRSQKGNYGSFDELLKTTDPSQTVDEFGHRFLVDRILVAAGTPKSIAGKLEEMHVASESNGGFILGRGYSAMDNIREFVEHVVPELQRRGLAKKAYTGRTLRQNMN
jgi:alkanesulfonate monooxygenase SsuD/methylene tetrahydromethanopterin reductase-like flavin-dependent oxidoreductase (luciferase family)